MADLFFLAGISQTKPEVEWSETADPLTVFHYVAANFKMNVAAKFFEDFDGTRVPKLIIKKTQCQELNGKMKRNQKYLYTVHVFLYLVIF